MTNEELGHLFGLFRKWILSDMSDMGYPTSLTGSILNWFDPRQEDYLQHVDWWKQFLARGVALPGELPESLSRRCCVRTSWDTDSVLTGSAIAWLVRYTNAIANLFYKSHCPPRRKTDWDAVKLRLSAPPELSLTNADVRRLRDAVRHLDVLPDVDGLGSYGPGITSEGYTAEQRWNRIGNIPPVPPTWYRWNVLDNFSPSVDFSIRYTRIAEVPKTLKSNRVISSEPAQSMYAQKSIAKWLDMGFQRFFPNCVSLHDQSFHNRLLVDPDYRTIDLSDASDYVSCDLVSRVVPSLWPLLAAVRSTHALFPDGDLVPLRTFAPMGSGVCFPVLTLINLAICLVNCRHPFSVYGDDVIAHRDDIVRVMEWQTAAGLRLNQGKTCLAAPFRESCGVEMFGDMDITPIYIRERIESTDWKKIDLLIERFDEIGWSSCGRGIACLAAAAHHPRYRVNPAYQRRELLVPVYIRVDREGKVDGYAGLRKWYLTRNPTREMPESSAVAHKGRLKLVYRYRSETDYPHLVEAFDKLRLI